MRSSNQKRLVVVSGIDGSGKTTIIEAIRGHLAHEGISSSYVWLRYNHYLTKFLLAYCRISGLTRYEHFKNSRVGYHEFHKSRLISWAFIGLTFVDTFLVTLFKVYIPLFISSKTIICDRWIVDILVDLEIDTRIDFSSESKVSRLFRRLLPKDCIYIIVKREIDTVRQARDESMNDRNFPRRYDLYEKHSKKEGVIVIDNSGLLDDAIMQVKELFT